MEILFSLCEIYVSAGPINKTQDCFKTLRNLTIEGDPPTQARYHYLASRFELSQQNVSKAIDEIKWCLSLQPNHRNYLSFLVNLLDQAGRYDEAIMALKKMQTLFSGEKQFEDRINQLNNKKSMKFY